ncbi:MAG: insulinase family protein [Candidatus Eremiobacteraeota bacterium]|nr:insulinase family protein [Candidatus Eremiobacteraeota bacterium]
MATLMVVYRIGSRNEAVGYTGSSHLLEHMLFKGTAANNRGNGRAFADMMNEIGASKNATTWIDRTNYFETVPIGYLDFAIELEADRMRGAFVADSDRRSEMTVVRNELERNDNNTARVLNSAVVATAFREHPYHHPTIGWRTDVEGVSTTRLRELYDTFYHPDNATVFVVGDIDVARTRATVERHFGTLPRAANAVPDVYTEEPPQAGERTVVVKRPGETTTLSFAYHTPAAFGQHTVLSTPELALRAETASGRRNDEYALEVLGRILGRGRTSRLSRALVDSGLALDASAWNWGSRDPGLFQIVVNVRPSVAIGEVRGALERVLDGLAREGPLPEELERAQRQIEVQRAFARDGTFALAQRLGEFEAVGSWRLDEDYVERTRAVTCDDVVDAMNSYLHEDNRTVGMLLSGTAKTFDHVPFEPVEIRRDAETHVEAAELPQPQPMPATSFADRVVRGTLGNGTLWSYVRSGDNPTIALRGILEAGRAFAPGRPLLPTIVAEMLSRGTTSHPRREIENRLERAGVRRTYYVDDDASHGYNALAFRFAAACEERDLPLLLETLAEEFRSPAFLDDELALVKAELIGTLRLARTSTNWRAVQRFAQLAYEAGDVNDAADCDALLADVERTTVDDVRDFHARVVLGAIPIVAAAGSPNEDAFGRALEATFGSVPFVARGMRTHPTVRARPAREVFERVALERKANVDIIIGRATSLVRADADYLAASVANGILGQSTLSSRLGLRLRDREGLTYGVTSGFMAPGRLPGPWRVGVSVNPANVDRAVASVRDVLRDYADGGPTPRELIQQTRSMAGQHHVALATSGGIAAQLERIAYYALGDDYVDNYATRVAAVPASDVAAAVVKYFSPDELIVVAAGTFVE